MHAKQAIEKEMKELRTENAELRESMNKLMSDVTDLKTDNLRLTRFETEFKNHSKGTGIALCQWYVIVVIERPL